MLEAFGIFVVVFFFGFIVYEVIDAAGKALKK